MTVRSVFAVVMLFSSLAASAQNTPEKYILDALDAQVRAWNQGDVASFMSGYHDSDSTRFVSSKGVAEGYSKVLARYLAAYPTKEKMGMLSFSDLTVRVLSDDVAIVVGQWRLQRRESDGGNVGGYFTLIFQRTAKGWKIIHDHTS